MSCECSVCCKQDNISLTNLKSYGLILFQPSKGYRFSVDALLLAEFVSLKKRAKVMELGTGTGVIGLILAKKFPDAQIHAIEIQEGLYELAKRNIQENNLGNIQVERQDIRLLKEIFPPGRFDHIVTNPPFRPTSSGRLCPNPQEAISRHEILVTLEDIIEAAVWLLRPGGRFSLIYPAERLAFLLTSMSLKCIEPKRLCCVHPNLNSQARMVLVEGIKNAGVEVKVEPPRFLNEESKKRG